jgi:hypothetical protein
MSALLRTGPQPLSLQRPLTYGRLLCLDHQAWTPLSCHNPRCLTQDSAWCPHIFLKGLRKTTNDYVRKPDPQATRFEPEASGMRSTSSRGAGCHLLPQWSKRLHCPSQSVASSAPPVLQHLQPWRQRTYGPPRRGEQANVHTVLELKSRLNICAFNSCFRTLKRPVMVA